MKSFESFSTSRQEKSRIVIEKLDGIVEPNVTTPRKSCDQSINSNSNSPQKTTVSKRGTTYTTSPQNGSSGTETPVKSTAPLLPPPELDGVNPGLTARLER